MNETVMELKVSSLSVSEMILYALKLDLKSMGDPGLCVNTDTNTDSAS